MEVNMNIKKRMILFLLAFFLAGLWLEAGEGIFLTLRLYKGIRDSGKSDPGHLNSYSLKKIADTTILSDEQALKEKNSIIKIYNLKYAHYLYKFEMMLSRNNQRGTVRDVVLDQRELNVVVGHVIGTPATFRATILSRQKNEKPLMESDVIIPEGKTAVLGFEDSEGKIYFLALRREKDQNVAKNETIRSIEVPKLISRFEPRYPSSALVKNIDGLVILECHTDLQGQVNNIQVIEGPPELAEPAKIDILKWKYSPWKINGNPEPVRMHLMIFFKITDNSVKSIDTSEAGIEGTYERYKPMMKKWKTSYPVSEENKAILEIIIVEGKNRFEREP
jgi:hypothetical protein